MKTKFNFTTGQECALSDLAPGQQARVQGVDVSTPAGRRLLDLGFLPDTPLRVLRTAPLGDPVVYEIRGYRVCLRRADAVHIRVRVEENG
jgi:ferrous iron transport protein A